MPIDKDRRESVQALKASAGKGEGFPRAWLGVAAVRKPPDLPRALAEKGQRFGCATHLRLALASPCDRASTAASLAPQAVRLGPHDANGPPVGAENTLGRFDVGLAFAHRDTQPRCSRARPRPVRASLPPGGDRRAGLGRCVPGSGCRPGACDRPSARSGCRGEPGLGWPPWPQPTSGACALSRWKAKRPPVRRAPGPRWISGQLAECGARWRGACAVGPAVGAKPGPDRVDRPVAAGARTALIAARRSRGRRLRRPCRGIRRCFGSARRAHGKRRRPRETRPQRDRRAAHRAGACLP